MTIIIGVEYKGKTFLGSDSSVSDDSIILKLDRSKIIQRENIAIAFCSSFRVGQIIEYNFDFKAVRKSEKWLYSKFPGLVRETLEKNGAKVFDDGERTAGVSEFVVAHSGKVYIMQADFSIFRNDKGYAALGSGENFAYGSLHSTSAYVADPIKRIRLALEAAAEFDPRCAPPFHIVELPG